MVRYLDLVKGDGEGRVRPREANPVSRRMSDLIRQDAAPESSGQDSRAPRPKDPATHEPSRNGRGSPLLAALESATQALQNGIAILGGIFEAVRDSAPVSLAPAGEVVEELLRNLEKSDTLLVPFYTAGDQPPDRAREAVNVCILSLKVGLELGYERDELGKLGLTALLCDIEQASTPVLLRHLAPKSPWLAEVVERCHGSALPRHHPEDRIDEYASIIRLAAIYTRLVHQRPAHQRIGPLETLREILRRERATFSDRLLKAMIRTLSAFPVGSLVRLNTGEIGRVVSKNKDFPLRPVVEILVRESRWLEEPVKIDLSQSPLHQIEDSVAEEAIP